jgi:hypothetical protein
VDGQRRIISDPPLVVPLEELVNPNDARRFEDLLTRVFAAYRDKLQADRRLLLDGYRPVHMAQKVVGMGSVGTRAWIMLLLARDAEDPLVLQVKGPIARCSSTSQAPASRGKRGQLVGEGQRLMRAASDVFLGWLRVEQAPDGATHDYTSGCSGTRRAQRRSRS